MYVYITVSYQNTERKNSNIVPISPNKGVFIMNYLSIFSDAVKQYSSKPALVDMNGSRTTSYEALDKLSDKVCAKLMSRGIQDGYVIVNMGRRMEYISSYLGILKAGASVVPVIPEYPKERIDYISKDCGAKEIITEAFFDDIESYDSVPNANRADNEPALLVYTSGSTGTPKGIRHSVGAVAAAVNRQTALLQGFGEVVFGGAGQMSFVVFSNEYLAVFAVGGCTHILEDSVRKDIRLLEAYYDKHNISVGFISPQMLKFLGTPCSLKRVLTGSEVLRNTYSDKYEIYRVSSTRFLAMDYMTKPMTNSVLYGGVYYDSDTTTMKQESERYSTRSATYSSFAEFNKGEDRGSLKPRFPLQAFFRREQRRSHKEYAAVRHRPLRDPSGGHCPPPGEPRERCRRGSK